MQILSLPATSSENNKPQWIEFINMLISLQVPSAPGTALTAAVPVPDLHAVLLLRDGVDPVVGLAAVPVVVVEGGAVRPLEVTLLARGQQRKATITEMHLQRVGVPLLCRLHIPPQCCTARGRGERLSPLSKGQTAHLGFTAETYPGKPQHSQLSHQGKPRNEIF